jgi:hypothetical protein
MKTHLYQILEPLPFDVVELGGEDKAGASTELPVGLADDVFQYQLLEVDVGLKKGYYFFDKIFKILTIFPPGLDILSLTRDLTILASTIVVRI